MGIAREVLQKKYRTVPSLDKPVRQFQVGTSPNQYFITHSEKVLVDLIRRHGEFSKADLVSFTDYSRTKITTCISSLLEQRILVANHYTEFTGGRRSKKFSLNGNFGLVAGVDIGATSIDLGIADFSGRLLVRYSEPASVREGPIRILARVCSLLEKLTQENGSDSARLNGIGIGVPGPVDFSVGTLVSPPIMPGWDRYPIIQTVQQWFPQANVVVDNDVNLMALGEIYQGAGRETDNLIFIKIGTGIGAGIICEGKIYRGASGCAGDIGHICVDKNGPVCHCGNRGCLEAVAGGPAIADRAIAAVQAGSSLILQKYYETNGNTLRAEDVGNASGEGDAMATHIIRESGQAIGDVLAGMVNFYNPGMIVIGGGVSHLGDLLLSSIRQTVLRRSLPLATRDLLIVFTEIGTDAGVIGAINLAMDNIFALSPNRLGVVAE
ncbi:MAG: ROK family protein [Anaerolineae bacterium]|nr:ROK family protein [Anaerolineae bacterium]